MTTHWTVGYNLGVALLACVSLFPRDNAEDGASRATYAAYVFNSSILNSKYIHTIKVNTKSEETADYALALTSTSISLYASHFSVLGEISVCSAAVKCVCEVEVFTGPKKRTETRKYRHILTDSDRARNNNQLTIPNPSSPVTVLSDSDPFRLSFFFYRPKPVTCCPEIPLFLRFRETRPLNHY